MRECIYCGRSLEKGEVCMCAMSVAKRKSKGQEDPKAKKEDIRAEKKAKKARERQAKREQREQFKKYQKERVNFDTKGIFSEFWRLLVSFVKSPVETVMNPGEMRKGVIILFAIIEGMIGGLSVYSITSGAGRGAFKFLGNIMGFGGVSGYGILKGWLLSAFSGAVTGVVMFFVYSGIFYIINRWIFKQFTPYWEFVKRFAFVAIPTSLIGILCVFLGLFSQITFLILMISGLVGAVLITYELLRSVWYSKSASVIIYTMMAGIFVFLTVLINLIRFA